MSKLLPKRNRGFTLIELMVAVSIFAIVMTISMSSIISVYSATNKSRTLKSIMNNLNLAMEVMSREMRYGKNYHCGSTGTLALPQNCASGDNYLSFLSSDNTQITYSLSNSSILKQVGNNTSQAVTSPDVIIDDLTFYALGALNTDTLQPKVVIKLKGHSGTDKNRSDFILETLVSQRAPDL